MVLKTIIKTMMRRQTLNLFLNHILLKPSSERKTVFGIIAPFKLINLVRAPCEFFLMSFLFTKALLNLGSQGPSNFSPLPVGLVLLEEKKRYPPCQNSSIVIWVFFQVSNPQKIFLGHLKKGLGPQGW
ncbi:MAG: hypothetical protein CM15mP4_1060 [Candidatus Neomarinimicrobiota bacterium]|nr:MAG: hypothetical protein CM15mP4_1060 [Candidatus Neomarinimicrobiota bacterium]